MILVEIANIEIILTSLTPTDIVYNFIALAVIAEFDDFVFYSLRGESMKKLIDGEITETILITRHTTSKKCKDYEQSDVVDESGEKRPLRVRWESRSCANKFFYLVYKVLKVFYTSLFFYFLPFSTIILTCLFPIVARYTN